MHNNKEKLATERLAGILHGEWQKARNYEPRVKPTTDQKWIAEHGGKKELDIANTSFERLPADWQAENRASAAAAVRIVSVMKAQGKDLTHPSTIEAASDRLHQNWLSRNGSWAPAERKVPYSQLSPEEKAKDRLVIQQAINVVNHIPEQK